MNENQGEERTDYEVLHDLKPVGEMSPDEVRKEIAQGNADLKHPYWDDTHPQHKQAIDRMSKLWQAKVPTKSPLEKSLNVVGIYSKEDIDEVQQNGFDRIKAEQVERELGEIQNKLALAFPDSPKEEISQIIEGAQGTFKTLREQGIVAQDFQAFIDETGEGDKPEVLKLFSDVGRLQARFLEWKEKKRK